MKNTFTERTKTVAIDFATWLEDNAWTAVWSDKLSIRAYVDASKYEILINGSDEHFTRLIKRDSKSLSELYEMFVSEMSKSI